jgi:hypothetical protein
MLAELPHGRRQPDDSCWATGLSRPLTSVTYRKTPASATTMTMRMTVLTTSTALRSWWQGSRPSKVLSFAAPHAQPLYAAPSHLVCFISGD